MSGSNSFPPTAATGNSTPSGDEPLGLTVHSMPHLDAAVAAQTGNTRAAKIKLLLLLLVSAAPVIASYFTYYVIRPEGRRNYGVLIDPQRPMPPDLIGVDLQGKPRPLTTLMHQWLLVSIADSKCDQACEKHLYLSRQLRESLGKDKERADWVWFRTGDADVPQALLPALATAQVVKFDQQSLAGWLQPDVGHALGDHLYVVDPMGNWMMRFPADADPMKVRKDLERLMRGSSAWDKPGRP